MADDYSAIATPVASYDDISTPVAKKKTPEGLSGDLQALLESAARGAPEAAAFLGGMGVGGAVTKNPVGSVVGGLGGGIAAALAESKIQGGAESLLPKDALAYMNALEQEHPKSAILGRLLSSGFKPSLKLDLVKRLAPATLGGVQQATADAMANKEAGGQGLFPEGELGRVLPAVAIGGLMNAETSLGRRITGAGGKLVGVANEMTRPANPAVTPQADQINRGVRIQDILNNASTKGTLAQANQTANEIALKPAGSPPATNAEMPFDAPPSQIPLDLPTPAKDLPEVLPPPVMEINSSGQIAPAIRGPLVRKTIKMQDKSLEGLQPVELKAPMDFGSPMGPPKKTPKATQIQKDIEKQLGIGQPKGITESDADYNARILDEAKARNEIEQANAAVDEALGVTKPEGRASVDEAPKTALSDLLKSEAFSEAGKPDNAKTGPLLDDLVGQKATFEGKSGTLIKQDDGQFGILPDVQTPGKPVRIYDIPGAKGEGVPAKDVKVVPKGVSRAGERGAILNPFETAKNREEFYNKFSKAFDATQERTEYGLRSETPKERSMVMIWSNNSSKWIPGRSYPAGKPIENLDANHIVVPWMPNKLSDLLAEHLPPLPLDAFSAEKNPLFELKPGMSAAEVEDVTARYGARELKKSDKQYYFDALADRINAEFKPSGISDQSAFINPSVMAHLGSTGAGALIGYQTGDTPEEKRRNAILGALAGLGGSLSAHAGLTLAKKNPALLDQIKALTADPEKQRQTQLANALQKQTPSSVPVDSSSGVGQKVGQIDSFDQIATPTRKPIVQGSNESPKDYRKRVVEEMGKINDRVQASKTVDVAAKHTIADMAAQADRAFEPASYLEQIHNRMLELEAGGRQAVKARDAVVKQDIADKTDEIKSDQLPKNYRRMDDLKRVNETARRLSLGERLGAVVKNTFTALENGYNAIDQHTANRDTVLNMMDGFKGFRGALNRVFGGTLDLAYTKEQNLKSDWKDPIRQAVALKLEHGLVKTSLEKLGFGLLDDKSLERVNVYAHRRMDLANPDIPNTHLADSGITPEFADSIKLTPPEQAYYDAARQVLDTQSGPTVRQAMHDGFNVDVGQIKDYWPTQVIGRRSLKTKALGTEIPGNAGHEAAIDDLIKSLTSDFSGRPTTKTNEGQTKEKTAGAGGEINLRSDLIDRHLNQAAHLVSHAKELQSLGKIARQPWFAEKYGQKGQKYVLDLLDSVARDSDPAGSRRIPVVDAITKNYAVAILALRAFSQLKHVSNVAYAANEIGSARFISGLTDANTDAGKAFLKKNFPESYQRSGGETTIQELMQGNRWQKAQAGSFFIERIADRQIAGAATLGAYKNELERLGVDTSNYLKAPVNSDAQKHALIIARKIVTSSLRKDSPQAISRGALTGGSMTLSRAGFQFLQTAMRQVHYAKTEVLDEGVRKGDLLHASAAVAAMIAALAFETEMVESSKKMFGAKEKPTDALTFPGEMAKEAVRKIPFVGNAMAAAGHGDTGIPSVDLTVHGIHSLGQLYTGKNEFGTTLRGRNLASTKNDALTFAGSALGVPGASTIGQAYKNRVIKK